MYRERTGGASPTRETVKSSPSGEGEIFIKRSPRRLPRYGIMSAYSARSVKSGGTAYSRPEFFRAFFIL